MPDPGVVRVQGSAFGFDTALNAGPEMVLLQTRFAKLASDWVFCRLTEGDADTQMLAIRADAARVLPAGSQELAIVNSWSLAQLRKQCTPGASSSAGSSINLNFSSLLPPSDPSNWLAWLTELVDVGGVKVPRFLVLAGLLVVVSIVVKTVNA